MNFQHWFKAGNILALHLIVMLALVMGSQREDWLAFAIVYPCAAIGVGVAMHRYFAHGAFHTSRGFQLLLALMAALSFGNAVHFAGKHKLHHRYSDTDADVHTPLQGWWQCWLGSMVDCGYTDAEIREQAQAYFRYPELAWLYRHGSVPALLLCAGLYLLGGFSMMAIGGLFSPVLLLHQSSAVNYLCHCRGNQRYRTRDQSRNNSLVALLTFGEGWHNNHHRFPRSARAGLCWWEIDMFYWVICLFEIMGLVWDVQRIPSGRLQAASTGHNAGAL